MSFSIRLSSEERQLAESYAKLHSISLGDAFKTALFERIEEEYDILLSNKCCEEFLSAGKKSRPIQDLREELKL